MSGTAKDYQPAGLCQWCGHIHSWKCPLIKSIEYSETNPGLWKRVEFFAPSEQYWQPAADVSSESKES